MVWLDNSGKATPAFDVERAFVYARLSPDEKRVAVSVSNNSGLDLWMYDLERGSGTRLTLEGNNRRTVSPPTVRSSHFSHCLRHLRRASHRSSSRCRQLVAHRSCS